MNTPMAWTLVAAALLSGCSGRLQSDSSKSASPVQPAPRIPPVEGATSGAVAGGSVGATSESDGGAAVTWTPDAESPDATSDREEIPSVVAGDLDAGGGCASLSFVDPTSSVPLSGSSMCTRRNPGAFSGCPAGIGQSNTVVIGPSGGTVQLEGQQGMASGVPFEMMIPPNALTTATTITVTELAVPPPAGFADWSPLYRLDPVDLVLAAPATLTVPFSNDCCIGNAVPCTSSFSRTMGLYWSGESTCGLVRLPDSYVNAGVEQASTTHLGFAAVGFASAGDALYCQ